ncbi:acetate--CoA ligase family protein [Candidatus Bipolaricaulota bacterium]
MTWANALFQPQAVAVVGSCSPGKIGNVLITQLLDGGFESVVAVNPKAQGSRGVPAVSSFAELPLGSPVPDLAMIASPAATVADVLEDAGAAGVKAAVIITAGFSESGNSQEEQKLLSVAGRFDMRIVGPNCAGIVNTKHNLFPTLETRPPSGDVAFVSQSGALGGAVLSWAEEQGVGFSKFVSYGNAVDLTEVDFLEVLREDDETKVVALYIETVSDGRRFMEAARKLAAVKPLVVIKSGRSESGGRAAQSHTGSMAGTDVVYEAALAQCGAIRVAGIEEMFDLCRGFVHLPRIHGKRVAVVTNSGGPGVLAVDAGDRAGLEISPPSPDLRARLADRLLPVCSLTNPFDLTVQGAEDDYRVTLIEALSEYDAALAINVNTPYLDVAPLARGVVAAAQQTGKPIAASFVAGRPAKAALPILAEGGVPNFVTGERGVRVLAHLAAYAERVSRAKRSPTGETSEGAARAQRALTGETSEDVSPVEAMGAITKEKLPWDRGPTEPQAMDWLESLGIPVIPRLFARTADEAVHAAHSFEPLRTLKGAVAMKVVSPRVVHKTDVGGVVLNLTSADEIEAAFLKMKGLKPSAGFHGVLVSPMIEDPVEAIVGLSNDRQFGSVIAVGLGGIYTEIFKDLVVRVAPVSVDEAHRMIESLNGIEILRGARGSVLRDIHALAQLASDVSQLPFRFQGIAELDLNPVFLFERGCAAGDVRLIPENRATTQRSN